MNLFQFNCVLDRFILGFRASRRMISVPSVLFCISLIFALTISQANGQNNLNNNGKKGKGIMCYVCNSARDPRCGDPFDSSTIEKVDCEQLMPNMNATVCRKNVQKATLGSRVDYRVVRACGYLPENPHYSSDNDDDDDTEISEGGRCYNKAGTFEVQVTYCSCHSDGCNPASRQAHSSFSMFSQTWLQLATMIAGSYLMLKDKKGFY